MRIFFVVISFFLVLVGVTCGEEPRPVPLTREQLENAEYPIEGVDGRPIRLQNGIYRQKYDPTAASEMVVQLSESVGGDLDGDGVPDAVVVLVSDGGGSGIFYDLIAVRNSNGQPKATALVSLGDRARVIGLKVVKVQVEVLIHIRGEGDPLSERTKLEAMIYRLDGDQWKQIPLKAK